MSFHQSGIGRLLEPVNALADAAPAGSIPTVSEAKLRLDHLRQHGESPYAFSFKKVFPPPAESPKPVATSANAAGSA
jgi:hypothetical protein